MMRKIGGAAAWPPSHCPVRMRELGQHLNHLDPGRGSQQPGSRLKLGRDCPGRPHHGRPAGSHQL